jgi:hypothetical protein
VGLLSGEESIKSFNPRNLPRRGEPLVDFLLMLQFRRKKWVGIPPPA